ncbi:MAG TPA: response regulator transcription factor [Clostridia bacterium]|nr:response regulator transcription factor [Clostridia bacterium]
MIRILLVDDHVMVRQGLRALLMQEGCFQVVGETASGLEVARLVESLHPDVVVLDLMLPGLNGLEIIRKIRVEQPGIRVVVLSMYSNAAYVAAALRHGAKGYVCKDCGATDLITAIREAVAGRNYLGRSLNRQLIAQYMEETNDSGMDLYCKLTAREREVLSFAAHGLTNVEIGARLHISPRTVEIHRSHLMRKLGLQNQSELLRYAVERGILLVRNSPKAGVGTQLMQNVRPGSL